MSFAEKIFGTFSDRELKKINPLTKKVLALEPQYQAMSDADLQAQTPALKERLAKGETLEDTIRSFKAILSGEMDDYPESAFFNVGTIEDVKAKAAKEQ